MPSRRSSRWRHPSETQPPDASFPPPHDAPPCESRHTHHGRFFFHSDTPPPWWPPNEPWPPRRRTDRRRPPKLFLLLGCLIPFIFLASGFLCSGLLLTAIIAPERIGTLPHGGLLGLAAIFLLLVLIVAAAAVFLRRSIRPLGTLMNAADRVAEGDYSARIDEHGPREIRALIRSFNTMTGRLKVYDDQRKRLLADISHELRTPLTVLQGNLEGMLDGVYPRDDEHLQSLIEETRVLARLIEDLRTFTLAETGRLVLEKESCAPGRLAADVAAALRSQADAAGVELKTDCGSDLPALELDAVRIREVLENLVMNALRYTPTSGGVISISCRTVSGPECAVEFTVEDNGRGIPPEDLPHIFERYFKSRDSGGSGLGLAIAKRLVEAHGGSIEASSRAGAGTVIRFRIPGTSP